MRADLVVVLAPEPGDHANFLQCVEDLPVEQLVAEPGVERFYVPVLPGAAWFDEQGAHTDFLKPLSDGLGRELGPVVGTNVLRRPALDDEIGKYGQDIIGPEAPLRHHGQALTSELVDDVQHPVFPPVVGDVLNEVIAPDMARPLRPQSHARSIVEPEPPPSGLLLRHLETLPPPDPLDHRQADPPARLLQQAVDSAIAISPVLLAKLDDVGGQEPLASIVPQRLALGRAMLADHRTGAPLGDPENLARLLNANTATGGT